MIAQTAKAHFAADISRARNILAHAGGTPPGNLQDDVTRAAWMFAVGACDAYFCDAYVDVLAKTMRAKDAQRGVRLPKSIETIEVPLGTVLHSNVNQAWEWRMFARGVMERENVLSLAKVKVLFNPFFRDHHKVLSAETIERWILHSGSTMRLFGVTKTAYRASAKKSALRETATGHITERFREIFQRRNDCIHNCDRPRVALQIISGVRTGKVIDDIEFLVDRFHEDLQNEFTEWLDHLGFSGVTRNRVGA